LLGDPGDPINFVISLDNVPLTGDGADVITSKGFSERDFHLLLYFTYIGPDGIEQLITATNPGYVDEPEPPRRDPSSGEQVEPVEILGSGWILTVGLPDPIDARDYYSLSRAGKYSVKAVISLRTYPSDAVEYILGAPHVPIGTPEAWSGDIVSNTVYFSILTDADGDGYYYPEAYGTHGEADCDDANAAVNPGVGETLGNGIDDDCDPTTPDVAVVETGTIMVKVDKHIVGGGSHPGSSKEAIPSMVVAAFDKSPASCVMTNFGVSWQNYESIWGSCTPMTGQGISGYGETDGSGMVSLLVPAGDYLVIGEYKEDNADPIYIGVSAGPLEAGQTIQKYLQVIEKLGGKKVPAKYTKRKGSELLIIEPEYVEWDGTEELYPFIFESVGDWTVSTSVSPPEGFVSDNDSLTEEVNSDLKAVQFTITDVGSEWVATGVTHEIKHKKKKEKIKSKVGVKLTKKLAKEKGVDKYGKKKKNKDKDKN
jgi:hypothetical protein